MSSNISVNGFFMRHARMTYWIHVEIAMITMKTTNMVELCIQREVFKCSRGGGGMATGNGRRRISPIPKRPA